MAIHGCAVSRNVKSQIDLSDKGVELICDVDEKAEAIYHPAPKTMEKEDIFPGVVFSGGFDSLVVHYLTQDIFGNHSLFFVRYGKFYDREYNYAKKFNPIIFETNWREKVPEGIGPIQQFNIPMILGRHITGVNCFFRGNTLETIMSDFPPHCEHLAGDDFHVNIYEPIGSLFEPAVLRIAIDFMDIDETAKCLMSIANQDTEKIRRKKMMLNIVSGGRQFTIDAPRVKTVPYRNLFGNVFTALYLLKHLPPEEVELVYELSGFTSDFWDIVRNFRLTFFDRYNPMYLDGIARKHFAGQFERHGIAKYDDTDMKEYAVVFKYAKHIVELRRNGNETK